MKNFNGYGLFYDIKNEPLRTYNRINVYLNIRERHGDYVAHNYLRKFNRPEQVSIFKTMKRIKDIGYEQYRRDFIRARNA